MNEFILTVGLLIVIVALLILVVLVKNILHVQKLQLHVLARSAKAVNASLWDINLDIINE